MQICNTLYKVEYIRPVGGSVNIGTVRALPPDSEAQDAVMHFDGDRYVVPDFEGAIGGLHNRHRSAYDKARRSPQRGDNGQVYVAIKDRNGGWLNTIIFTPYEYMATQHKESV